MALDNNWFSHRIARPNAQARLFCFPYAGGAANMYRAWAAKAPPEIEVCPVQLPGRFSRLREPAHRRVDDLVRDVLASIGPMFDRPFALFGHSMGGLIAFEVARALWRERGREPLHLFISARRAPTLADPRKPTYSLPEAEFLAEVRRLQGTPAEVLEHPELIQLALPLLRADFELCETYVHQPGPPLACPITAFAGGRDTYSSLEDMEPWRQATSGPFQLHTLDGDHFFIHALEPLIRDVVFSALRGAPGASDRAGAQLSPALAPPLPPPAR